MKLTKEKHLAGVKMFRDMVETLSEKTLAEGLSLIEVVRHEVMDKSMRQALDMKMSELGDMSGEFGKLDEETTVGEFVNHLDMLENAVEMHTRLKNKDLTIADLDVQTNTDEEAAEYYDKELAPKLEAEDDAQDVESSDKEA